MRKIRNGLLVASGIVYRCLVVACTALFFSLGVKPLIEQCGPVGAAVIWGVVNMCIYYAYHFLFAKLFKLGKDEPK